MKKIPPSQDNLWAVISETRHWYLGIFTIIAIPSEIIVIIGEIADNQGIIDTWRAIIPPSSEVMGMSAGASFMLTETGRAIVVLAHGIKKWLDRREEEFRNKLLEEGREEGRDEERKAWLDWLSRKANAESRGENFTEPPPTRE